MSGGKVVMGRLAAKRGVKALMVTNLRILLDNGCLPWHPVGHTTRFNIDFGEIGGILYPAEGNMREKDPKADATAESIPFSTMERNWELLSRCALAEPKHEKKQSEDNFESSREVVRTLLSTLSPFPLITAPQNDKPSSIRHEFSVFRRTIASILDAMNHGLISKDEADAVINFLAERIIARKFDDIVTTISTPCVGRWFRISHVSAGQP